MRYRTEKTKYPQDPDEKRDIQHILISEPRQERLEETEELVD
jgi:hypothetical protein